MSLFYFQVRDNILIEDVEGVELPDLNAARLQAVRMAGQLLGDRPQAFLDDARWTIEIHDEAGLARSVLELIGRDVMQ